MGSSAKLDEGNPHTPTYILLGHRGWLGVPSRTSEASMTERCHPTDTVNYQRSPWGLERSPAPHLGTVRCYARICMRRINVAHSQVLTRACNFVLRCSSTTVHSSRFACDEPREIQACCPYQAASQFVGGVRFQPLMMAMIKSCKALCTLVAVKDR